MKENSKFLTLNELDEEQHNVQNYDEFQKCYEYLISDYFDPDSEKNEKMKKIKGMNILGYINACFNEIGGFECLKDFTKKQIFDKIENIKEETKIKQKLIDLAKSQDFKTEFDNKVAKEFNINIDQIEKENKQPNENKKTYKENKIVKKEDNIAKLENDIKEPYRYVFFQEKNNKREKFINNTNDEAYKNIFQVLKEKQTGRITVCDINGDELYKQDIKEGVFEDPVYNEDNKYLNKEEINEIKKQQKKL